MAQKRTHFKTGALVASTNNLRRIQAKRFDTLVRYVDGISPSIISTRIIGFKS